MLVGILIAIEQWIRVLPWEFLSIWWDIFSTYIETTCKVSTKTSLSIKPWPIDHRYNPLNIKKEYTILFDMDTPTPKDVIFVNTYTHFSCRWHSASYSLLDHLNFMLRLKDCATLPCFFHWKNFQDLFLKCLEGLRVSQSNNNVLDYINTINSPKPRFLWTNPRNFS